MIKTFFVLWIWTGASHSQTLAMDHFATKAECEAAKVAILNLYADTWDEKLLKRDLVCLEATVKE